MPDFRIFGHRGARGHAPENTLLALERGIESGADWLEFDIHQHPEGDLILLHDASVDRTTNGHGLLEELSFSELRTLDAGAGQQIPTLVEALDLIDKRVGVNVELKSFGPAAAALAAELHTRIEQGWPPQRFVVSSFHLPELQKFTQLDPKIPVAALVGGVPLDWAHCAGALGAVSLNVDAEFVDRHLVDDAHTRAVQLYAYTVNDVKEMQRLQAMGVDGVFTDYPERMRAVITSGAKQSPD